MSTLAIPAVFPATSPEAVENIKSVEEKIRKRKQVEFVTEHTFHAAMYARTVRLKAGVIFTNVLVKRATLLIIHGDIMALADDVWIELAGYNVCPAEAGRKQIYITLTDVEMTMIFPSEAQTVEEAESEFTDEAENLQSRAQENAIVRTPCLESPHPPLS
jgi:hypothetical protein